MPTPRDEEFIRFAAASGHLTEDQARQALDALREIEALGGSATAPDLLLKRGLLTEHQAALMHQAIAASKTATRVPRELGGFELIEKVGQGGMGTVFKARQKDLGRVVALKILAPRLSRSPEFVERFLREARAAGRLNHGNIVAAIDVGESQGFHYFAMEYVDGETLAQLLAREGPLPEDRALRIAADVARALDHANQKGLIHRDIKPGNIMVASDGRVRVADFGLAKALGQGVSEGTDAERFLGTPAYVAPEQIRSEPDVDCRADIFSLGVTLFQMLTGELPFQGANPMAIAAAVAGEPLPSLRKLRPDVSPATARVVETMTAKDRAERYATPAAAVAALESAAAAPRLPPAPPRLPPAPKVVPVRHVAARRHRSSVPAVLVALALLAVVGGLIALALHFRPRRDGAESAAGPSPTTESAVAPTTATPPAVPGTGHAVAADAVLGELARAVERANRLEAQNPNDFPALIGGLRQVLEEFPASRREGMSPEGLALLRQTEAKVKLLEERLGKASEAELKERSARALALVGEGKIDEAFALLDSFPASLRTKATAAGLGQLRSQCRQQALAWFAARDEEASRLLKQLKLDEAKAIYARLERCSMPEVAARARAALALIERDYDKKVAEAKRLARAAYVQEAGAVLELLEAREFREARTRVDAAVVNPALAPLREEAKTLQHLVRTVTEVWTTAELGLKKLKPGEEFRLGGLKGEVVSVEGDKLVLQIGKVAVGRRIAEMRRSDVLDLVLRGYGGPSPQVDAKLGLFLLAARDYDDARKRIESAKANGVDVTRETALLDGLAPRTCPSCQGKKAIPCPDCDGKGYSKAEQQECDACKGKGGGRCGWCKGNGRLRCANCAGTGRIAGGVFQCTECNGAGFVKCSHCGGDGHLRCAKCKGTGFVTTTTPCAGCKGAKTIPCPKCAGKGSLPPPDLTPPGEGEAAAPPTPAADP